MTVTAEGLRIELSESLAALFSIAAAPSSMPTEASFLLPLLKSSAAFPISFPLRGPPTPSPMLHRPPTAIGNFPPNAPTRPAVSRSPMEFAPIRSLKFAASPTSASENRTPPRTCQPAQLRHRSVHCQEQ